VIPTSDSPVILQMGSRNVRRIEITWLNFAVTSQINIKTASSMHTYFTCEFIVQMWNSLCKDINIV